MKFLVWESDTFLRVAPLVRDITREEAAGLVPEGVAFAIVEDLPNHAMRDGWRLVDGEIVVDESRIPVPDEVATYALLEELDDPKWDRLGTLEGLLTPKDRLKLLATSRLGRSHRRIAEMGAGLSLTDAEIDEVFRGAGRRMGGG